MCKDILILLERKAMQKGVKLILNIFPDVPKDIVSDRDRIR